MDQHRIGRFSVPYHMVEHHPQAVLDLFRDLIVVRCEFVYDRLELDYTAVGPPFDLSDRHVLALTYDVSYSHTANDWTIVRRLGQGGRHA